MYKRPGLVPVIALFGVQLVSNSWAAPLADPTRPYDYMPVVVKQEEPVVLPREQVQWELSVIRIGKDSRFAVINGQMVRPGEQVESARVLEINASDVVLEYDDQSVIVTLLDRAVKKTTHD